jgi:hypothetical protein
MNTPLTSSSSAQTVQPRIEFFRLPSPGKRDPYFGLSRGWYYKAAELGEIKMIALRQRGLVRGVRLVVYDSVCEFIRRAAAVDQSRAPSDKAVQVRGETERELTSRERA